MRPVSECSIHCERRGVAAGVSAGRHVVAARPIPRRRREDPDAGRSGEVHRRIRCPWTTERSRRLQSGTWHLEGVEIESAATRTARSYASQVPTWIRHDQIVKQWRNINSYVIKDGYLFLALMADGGIYEFEPRVSSKTQAPRR